ncbi:MAG: S9 family peptidase [Phycisphaerales bacterium]|nr:S9 family peptidase [Phycisphaerales bacterium]
MNVSSPIVRSVLIVLAAAGLSGAAAGMTRPESPAQPATGSAAAPGIDKFMKIRTPSRPTILPDGTLYTIDWPDGINQLYRSKTGRADAAAGGMEKLSSFKDGISNYSVSPDGKRVLMSAAVGGNENNQLYLLGHDGAAIPLTENPRVQHALNHWLDDSSGFYFTANDASPNDFYIYRYDFASDSQAQGGGQNAKGKATKLFGKEGTWAVGDASKDGKTLIVQQYISSSDTSVYTFDVASGELKEQAISVPGSPAGGTSADEIVGLLPDETKLVMLSDIADGRKQLFVKDLASGAVTQPITRLAKFEIDSAGISHDRGMMSVVTNEDGYGVLYLFKLPEFNGIALPPIEKGVVSVADIRNRTITWSLSNSRTAGVAYSYTVPTEVSGSARVASKQITFTDTQGIDLKTFPLPQLVKYKSFDGVEIPAFVFLPAGAKAGTPIPFIVNYHGGPESQSRPQFSTTTQYLVARGYGVMQPNVRGSSGYGRSFLMMDDYKRRWDSVKDGVEAARWLVKENYAKSGKIATYGGSYGGFMSVACLVEDHQSGNPIFGAGVNVVGIVNMKTFLEQTSGYRRKLREVEYGPLTDPEFLASISPLNKFDHIRVPMLIAHGLNDPRVPVGEAMQLAVALQKRGDDPELVFCPDEGHGFAKLENRLLFVDRMVKFLDKTIKD